MFHLQRVSGHHSGPAKPTPQVHLLPYSWRCESSAGWADHAEVETVLAMVEMRGLVTEPQQAQEDCRPAVQIGAVEARSRCSLLIAQLSR